MGRGGQAVVGGGAHRIRIVGGRWKRSLLPVPAGDGLRPTPDRVRETLFNWLGQDLHGHRVLDLFAGSGVLGIEAASRGAAAVVLVERDPRAARAIRAVAERLLAGDPAPVAITVVCRDAFDWLAAASDRFDLVFVDPPYGRGDAGRALQRIGALLAPGGQVYVESESPIDAAQLAQWGVAGLRVERAARAGQVHYHLLGSAPLAAPQEPAVAAPP